MYYARFEIYVYQILLLYIFTQLKTSCFHDNVFINMKMYIYFMAALEFTYFHLTKVRFVLFQAETIVANLWRLMVIIFKMFINSKTPVCGASVGSELIYRKFCFIRTTFSWFMNFYVNDYMF